MALLRANLCSKCSKYPSILVVALGMFGLTVNLLFAPNIYAARSTYIGRTHAARHTYAAGNTYTRSTHAAGNTYASVANVGGVASMLKRSPVFIPPVDAPVSDPFRMPDNPYGAGNRGVEYVTDAGDTVLASASGRVSFAGPVARELYVTLDHGGGLLSSYSYLQRINVAQGDTVTQGDIIGLASERYLHFSVRLNGEYVDPESYLGVRQLRVRLVHDQFLEALFNDSSFGY